MHGRNTRPLGAWGYALRFQGEEVVGVAEPLGLGPAFDRRELVAPPPQVAARDEPRVLEQPRVGVGVRMALDQHRRVLARLARRGADRLRRPHDVAHLSRLEHAGAERRRHLVPAADGDDGAGVQARRLGKCGRDG
jgi:hypothetical protein